MQIQITKTQIVFLTLKKMTELLKFMRDTTKKIRGHHMDMTNTTFICQGQNFSIHCTIYSCIDSLYYIPVLSLVKRQQIIMRISAQTK